MKTVTLADVLNSGYCRNYSPEMISRLWQRYAPADRSGNALDIIAADGIPAADRLWLVLADIFWLVFLPEESRELRPD